MNNVYVKEPKTALKRSQGEQLCVRVLSPTKAQKRGGGNEVGSGKYLLIQAKLWGVPLSNLTEGRGHVTWASKGWHVHYNNGSQTVQVSIGLHMRLCS